LLKPESLKDMLAEGFEIHNLFAARVAAAWSAAPEAAE
jgi:hypothetical protein